MPGNSPLHAAPKSSSDFWKFWAGQSISTLGSSFTGFALPLLIFKLTRSPLDLSFTVGASVLPYLFFGLVIGAWVDRVNRKRLMILTDLVRAVVIASIPLVSVFGLLSVWWIYAVVFVNSTLSICFDAANFAAIPGLVSKDDLVNTSIHGRQGNVGTTLIKKHQRFCRKLARVLSPGDPLFFVAFRRPQRLFFRVQPSRLIARLMVHRLTRSP